MPKKLKSAKTTRSASAVSTSAKHATSAKTTQTARNKTHESIFDKLQSDFQKNQSYLNLILGSLIVVVLGILIFNYFSKPSGNLGPANNTQTEEQQIADVSKDSLPGPYTVKEGDTLFSIAQKYYDDGYKYQDIVAENKLADGNLISVGQVLQLPKLTDNLTETNQALTVPSTTQQAPNQPLNQTAPGPDEKGSTGGAINETIWGEKITAETYMVTSGDWLSKIAGRAYGDIYQYEKIAKANNITDPNNIEQGTILKIPR